MALGAVRTKRGERVNGIIGRFEIGLMTGHALGGCVGIALGVANVAGNVIVTAGQGKAGQIMVIMLCAPVED